MVYSGAFRVLVTRRRPRRLIAAKHLAGFQGVLQVDGYGAYKALARTSGIELAFCWSHARRLFYDELDRKAPEKTPIAAEALARIQQLYSVEGRHPRPVGGAAPRRAPGEKRARGGGAPALAPRSPR